MGYPPSPKCRLSRFVPQCSVNNFDMARWNRIRRHYFSFFSVKENADLNPTAALRIPAKRSCGGGRNLETYNPNLGELVYHRGKNSIFVRRSGGKVPGGEEVSRRQNCDVTYKKKLGNMNNNWIQSNQPSMKVGHMAMQICQIGPTDTVPLAPESTLSELRRD